MRRTLPTQLQGLASPTSRQDCPVTCAGPRSSNAGS
jgi:hypothetical protein